jgi:Ca2+-binding EF-hand superfamily protein
MFRTIARSVLTALPVTALSVCALAQTAAPEHPSFYQHMLQKMDTNGDGRISLDEYVAAATTRFQAADAQNKGSVTAADLAASPDAINRDQKIAGFVVTRLDTTGKGYVSQDDFVAAAKTRFAKMDVRGDGKLTVDELTRPWGGHGHGQFAQHANADASQKVANFKQKMFDRIDANHDGVITQDEYVAAATALYNKIDVNGTGEVTAQDIASSPRAVKREQRVASHEVKKMDTDSDGTVSQDEFVAAAKARFSKLDKNGDGFIDADEMPAHHWAHKQAQPNG